MYRNAHGYLCNSKNQLIHRVVAEEKYGGPLPKGYEVHHNDENKLNNSPDNLTICKNHKEHALLHVVSKVERLGGDFTLHKHCSYHKCLHSRDAFSTNPSLYDGLHNMCREGANEYKKENGLNIGKYNWRVLLNQQYRRIIKKENHKELVSCLV